MAKVIIDGFESIEEANAFMDWFSRNADDIRLPIKGKWTRTLVVPAWDGMDLSQCDDETVTFNVAPYALDEDEF